VSADGRSMRWWVPLAALLAVVVVANAAGLLFERRERDSHREPSLTAVRPPGEISCVALAGDTLYAGGLEGAWAIDMRTLAVTRPAFAAKVDVGHVRALLRSGDVLWVGHERGLTRVSGSDVRTCINS